MTKAHSCQAMLKLFHYFACLCLLSLQVQLLVRTFSSSLLFQLDLLGTLHALALFPYAIVYLMQFDPVRCSSTQTVAKDVDLLAFI